jgi:DNA-binding response OmpR family regulator
MKILLAEDETAMQRAIQAFLSIQHCEVDLASDGRKAVEMAENGVYDCYVFDIMMPGMNGIDALQHLRGSGDKTPAIFLTAKVEVDDRVHGLEAGADDYLTKPFAMKELLARIHSVTRRSEEYTPSKLTFGNVDFDADNDTLTCKSSIQLSSPEGRMMRYLLLNPQKSISSETLYHHVWNEKENPDADEQMVWIYISYLNQKLDAIDADIKISGEESGPFSLVSNQSNGL